MKKSTLFISAALTTFMLAIMFGVASAYQKIVQASTSTEAAAQQQSQPAEVAAPMATNTIVGGTMTIDQAAGLASTVIGRTDLYSAEIAQLNGVDAYLVTFSSGDIVYVSKNGQILSISKLPVTFISAPAAAGGGGGGGYNNGNSGGSSVTVSSSNDNSNYNDNGNYNDDDDDDHDDEDDDEGEHEGGDD